MRLSTLFSICVALCLVGCGGSNDSTASKNVAVLNSPLATVIQLQSAERAGDIETALNYLDVDRAYRNYVDDQYPLPIDVWTSQVRFFHSLSQSKKFTNEFRYEKYDIVESLDGNTCIVEFHVKDSTAQPHISRYVLELDASWKVVAVEWIK